MWNNRARSSSVRVCVRSAGAPTLLVRCVEDEMKVIGWVLLIIFLIGLLVVAGVLGLIF
jgi:hypothetical protein